MNAVVTPDRAKLARYGLTIEDVNRITETMAVGHATGEVLEGERRFAIVVKMAHGFAGDLEPLRALPLKSVTGQIVPLGDLHVRWTGGEAAEEAYLAIDDYGDRPAGTEDAT